VRIKGFGLAALTFAAASFAHAQGQPGKVGVINIQAAIASTKDGQKAASELESKALPKRKTLETKQNEINTLKDQLQKGQNTLSETAKQDLFRNIDTKTKSLNRDVEDAQAEFDQEQQKALGELGPKIMAVIDKYAKDNGFTLILDVSSQQTPVVYASNTIDVTREIIEMYDKNAGAPASPKPAAATPRSAPPPAGGAATPPRPRPTAPGAKP
jgi:outer membrane protein